ncbi:NifU family protein [Tateyamaria omphalii]|uniref:DUF6522 family protein n=1 Tax=Tateyamaria omphalii TaxID=299262 RepID=UPI001C992B84|nr:DUF6522 family protein [Tateyamaria omphalii]MBY5933528.1 NifU family protein [Tateyamaria omphalii]
MSDTVVRRRIRARSSARDDTVMGFVLDTPIQPGRSVLFDPQSDAPLAHALFAVPGIQTVEVVDTTIWVKKDASADWAALKPAIAAAIRKVLDETDAPLGKAVTDESTDPDARLLKKVEDILDRQVNPSVAAHGGHIAADRVEGGTVYLRMSGGCQGCAASAATLQQGVERMLRAALPQIEEIVDVTDHAAGEKPFYERDKGASPLLNRIVPDGVIRLDDGQVTVDPEYLAPRLGLTAETLRDGLRSGDVVGVTETGEGPDAGKTRIVLRSVHRAWAAEVNANGVAREIPPPRVVEAAANKEQDLSSRVRTHLETLEADDAVITYGALARALGLWMPGSISKVTRALEKTMREDAAAKRPFIAARAVSRGRENLPGKGFFELAQILSHRPSDNESEVEFHRSELQRLSEAVAGEAGAQRPSV